jgi:Zn-dependent M16 (insulinase) family peptidase
MIDINWALPEAVDTELVWGLNVLSYALVGTQASPLRKALIDSGLGEDLTGSGLSTSLRQMTFSVGMKGIRQDDAAKVETVVYDTLRELAAAGFEPDMVEAAVNSIEFSLRENNTGSYPRGLGLMMRTLNTWNYGRDPLIPLKYEAPLTAVKANLAHNPPICKTSSKLICWTIPTASRCCWNRTPPSTSAKKRPKKHAWPKSAPGSTPKTSNPSSRRRWNSSAARKRPTRPKRWPPSPC